jgi:hypothetical protein
VRAANLRYVIFCDESSEKGTFYSNFYGGAVVLEQKRQEIEGALQSIKDDANIFDGEMKWTKITERYEDRYIEFIETFFNFVANGDAKVRIMFTQNINTRPRVVAEESGNEYFLLYYQFLKHAFGFRHSQHSPSNPAQLAVFLDDVPQKLTDYEEFKDYLSSLSVYPFFRQKGISLPRDQIAAVNSKSHNILQAVDIILGAMQFRLNDKHQAIPLGKRVRAKRTRSKERVYKRINSLIRGTYAGFNIGVSTGHPNGLSDRWDLPYRHWVFVPNDSVPDLSRGKKK